MEIREFNEEANRRFLEQYETEFKQYLNKYNITSDNFMQKERFYRESFTKYLRKKVTDELLKENNMKKGDLFDPPFTYDYLHDCVEDEIACMDDSDVFEVMTNFCGDKRIFVLQISNYWDEFLDYMHDRMEEYILADNGLTFDDLSDMN